jgi:hypothetical protein
MYKYRGTVEEDMLTSHVLGLLAAHKVLHNGGLGRQYKKVLNRYPELMQMVIRYTSFFKTNATPRERIYSLILGVTHQPECRMCKKPLQMRLSGVYKHTYSTYCSNKCSAANRSIKC